MFGKNNILKKIYNYFYKFNFSDDDFEYTLGFGTLGLGIILVKAVLYYAFVAPADFENGPLYLVYIGLLSALLLLLVLIILKKISKKSRFARILLNLFPFMYMVLSVYSAFLYPDIINQALSFVLDMLILSWIQIYPAKPRFALFSLALLSYSGTLAVMDGFTSDFFKQTGWILLGSIISYIAAYIHFVVYTNQKGFILELEQSNEELKQSHNVTASMLGLTQEVLRNENIGDIMKLVLDEAMHLIPNSQAGSILIKKENMKMEYVAANGYSLENLQKIDLHYNDLYQAALDDPYEPTVLKDLKVFDEVHIGKEKTQKIWPGQIAQSCLTCSFQFNGEFYGSINIDNFDSPTIFTDNDRYLLKQLAQELEIIISVHDLYEKALRPTKYDELTQAYTRRYCMKLLNTMVKKHEAKLISICTLDIDHLKEINDKYGHDVGDNYLQFFADGVRQSVTQENLFGRFGGDEFLIIFKGLNEYKTQEQINLIHSYFDEKQFIPNGHEEPVLFSVGIALYPADGEDIPELIKISDKRMYQDKRNKRKKK